MRNAELTCLDKEDDAPQQVNKPIPVSASLNQRDTASPSAGPIGWAFLRRGWLRRRREARVRIGGRDPASTTVRRGFGLRRAVAWKRPRWKWKDGEREGNRRGRKAGNRRGASCRRRWAVLVDATDGLESWAFWAVLSSAPRFLRPLLGRTMRTSGPERQCFVQFTCQPAVFSKYFF